MITGININSTRSFVSTRDPGKDNPTVFHIGILDPFIRSWIDDRCTSLQISQGGPDAQANASIAPKKMSILHVKYGVRAIDNLIDPLTKMAVLIKMETVSVNGKAYQALPDEVLCLLGTNLIDELAAEIIKEQDLSEAAQKN